MKCSRAEPIAIIGIGCRFPSAPDAEALWTILTSGREVLERVPDDRYVELDDPAAGGAEWALWLKNSRGGFLRDIDRFDAAAFGIAPREARVIDPQHRLLLETAWEALDDAGQDMRFLAGRPVGVYVGVWGSDYESRLLRLFPNVDIAMTTGGGSYAASGRVSYAFGFEGPSVTIDTACSSSLVAVHAACQALRAGECELALAGGVNLILDPAVTLAYRNAGALSPDGRCKFGDASADGFVRSEGAGMLVLKTVGRALSDNDQIHAVIRASAVSHTGRTGGSLMAPGEASQLHLFETALAEARLTPSDLDYIEAHGTGTRVGDRIELRALGDMLRRGRSEGTRPCLVGSVKTNIGHTESAAGVAGIIKTALCLKHRLIPPSLNFHVPNPDVDWDALPLRIPTAATVVGGEGRPIYAGVNSFGITGALAHVILEEAQDADRPSVARRSLGPEPAAPLIFPLSARSPPALAALAQAVGEQLLRAPDQVLDIAGSAALRRTHHDVRLCAIGRNAESLASLLMGFAHGDPAPGLHAAVNAVAAKPIVGWVFSGQGPIWAGMGCQLYKAEPAFRRMLDEIDTLIRAETGESIIADLSALGSRSRLDRTQVAQPAIFSIQVALAGLLGSWGLRPSMIVGHSVGEIAAAHVAGVLTLDDAVRLVCGRARIAEKARGLGRMAAVELALDEAVRVLNDIGGGLCVAAINAPRSLTISGHVGPLQELGRILTAQGRFFRLLDIDYPFHSSFLDPLLPEMLPVSEAPAMSAQRTPLYSTVFGRRATDDDFIRDYWSRNLRETVRFAPAIEAMSAAGCDLFVEISPHPVLSYAIKQTLSGKSATGDVLTTMRRQGDEAADLRGCASAHFVKGLDLDWSALAPQGRKFAPLPSYPWQREPHWIDDVPADRRPARTAQADETRHPLLQNRHLPLGSGGAWCWQSEISIGKLPWLADHCVRGRATFPAAAYVVAGLTAADQISPGARLVDVVFHEALFLSGADAVILQVQVGPDSAADDGRELVIEAAPASLLGNPRRHVTARVIQERGFRPPPADFGDASAGSVTSSSALYEAMRKAQLEYGPSFRCVESLRVDGSTVLATLKIPEIVQAQTAHYGFHPAILDACLQALVALTPCWGAAADLWLPQAIGEVFWRKWPQFGSKLTARAVAGSGDGRDLVGDVRLMDETGEALLDLRRVRLHRVAGGMSTAELLHEIRWVPCPRSPPEAQAAMVDHRQVVLEASAVGPTRAEQTEIRRVSAISSRLAGIAAQNALRAMGFDFTCGRRFAARDAAIELGIAPGRVRFLSRLLEMLADAGIIRAEGVDWRIMAAPPSIDLASELESAAATTRNSGLSSFWRLFSRASLNLPEVLTGRADAVEFLFGGEGAGLLEELYSTHLFWRSPMRQLAEAVASIARQSPGGRPLRVLEIGAGFGGLTRHLLPRLPPERTQYFLTDISGYFLTRAKQLLSDYRFLSGQILDIERSPLEQGFELADFDIVVSANCLHATRDLGQAIEHAALLLKPGGFLLLQEETVPERWTDLIFGLTDGWWRFADTERRPHHPLIGAAAWTGLLGEKGFASVSVLGGEPDAPCGAAAIIAQKAGPTLSGVRPTSVEPWLVLADARGLTEPLVDRLRDLGQPCRAVRPGFSGDNTVSEAVKTYLAGADRPGQAIVDLRPLDISVQETDSSESSIAVIDRGIGAALDVLSQSIGCERSHPPRVILVTEGSQATGLDQCPAAPAQASLWTIARCAALENPHASIGMIDLDGAPSSEAIEDLARELLDPTEPEIALRRGGRLARRLYRCDRLDQGEFRSPPGPFRLAITRRGSLNGFESLPLEPASPVGSEVQIRAAAAGLNFRDVVNLLGEVDEIPLGLECSGIVTAIGPDVTDVAVGDEVIAAAFGSWRTHVTTQAALTAPRPPHLTHSQAAALPIAYLTAHYALRRLVCLKPGQRVLIHSAAGGVGLAVLHMALAAGAEVVGTAGSPGKRDYLRAHGVKQALDSRSLRFADEIRSTAGGVDVVINSLAGAFIPASLDLLVPGGAFIEIGKRDIWSDADVADRRPDVAYHVLDLADIMRNAPESLTPMLRRIAREVADETLPALPVRAFPMADAIGALRFMQEARHTGKIVLDLPPLAPLRHPQAGIEGGQTGFLITGGLGGLGLVVADWLAESGAGPLVLVGRNAPGQAALDRIAALRARGAAVFVERCDVGDEAELARLLARCGHDLPRLRGVFHLAGVLEDGLLPQLDLGRFQTVFRPKALGAWNLHRLTKGMPIEVFMLFSSWTALLGSPGQASHAAANAFLDALAHRRRAAGLPAQSINWGGWLEAGVAARPDRLGHLARQGVGALTNKDAIDGLAQVMARDLVQVGVSPFNPTAWRAFAPAAARAVSALDDQPAPEVEDRRKSGPVLAEAAGGPQLRQIIENRIREHLAQIFRMPVTRLDSRQAFKTLGLDSLTALELRNELELDTGLKLAAAMIFNYPTIASLASELAAQLGTPPIGAASPRAPADRSGDDEVSALLSVLQGLPEEDALRLLGAEAAGR
jgi:acyl transferase domain-containing protein/NADPH:quinone reductase-like Zn-dependent oxidoreductase/SAM-dependent methyltransferase/acyl carrier protein